MHRPPKRITLDVQQKQRLVCGILNFCICQAAFSVLVMIIFCFAFGSYITPMSIQRAYHKVISYSVDLGWAWSPLGATPASHGISAVQVLASSDLHARDNSAHALRAGIWDIHSSGDFNKMDNMPAHARKGSRMMRIPSKLLGFSPSSTLPKRHSVAN
mmetsp:Transcript_60080/g.105130  ORF Transcript_60080/g.105130 Transcript_60080/m.105130 type:complete len:158 (-) Transcript_60080:80-553(-)